MSYNVRMASDAQRYRALSLNVAGFALMTPFSKMILNILLDGVPDLTLGYIARIFVALVFLLLGIIFVAQGVYIVE